MSSNDTVRSRRTRLVLTAVGLLVAAAAIVGVIWFFGRETPVQVGIDRATSEVEATDAAAAPSRSTDGVWSVDTSVGEFSVEDTTGTFVGFRVQEELANIGANEAVGRTPKVEGSITIEAGRLTAAQFVADLTGIVSNEPRRDRRIQEALETSTHPTATFTLMQPVELGDVTSGEVVRVEAPGTLTIHGVSNRVNVPIAAVLRGDTIVVTGAFEVTFADYGVQVPSAPIVLSAEDHGQVELQLYLTRS
ncbi:MAG: YceI family protein [Nitriliruptorales bacterium]